MKNIVRISILLLLCALGWLAWAKWGAVNNLIRGKLAAPPATAPDLTTYLTLSRDLESHRFRLAERYEAVFPSWLSPLYAEPISIDRGQGSYVWDLEGTRYLDYFGGVLTTMIGHNHPEVTAAVQEQAAKVMHSSTLYLNEPMIE